MADSGIEKRRSVRHQHAFPLEMRREGSDQTIKGETLDVSPDGCYVRLLSSFPRNTKLGLVLWVGSTPLPVTARVATVDPNIGNGMAFLDMTAEMRALVSDYLVRVSAPEAGSRMVIR